MFPPTVKVCPVREARGIPCVIVSMPQVWYRRMLKPADLILTHEERIALAHALLAADTPDDTGLDDDGLVRPARAEHAPRVQGLPPEEVWRFEVVEPVQVGEKVAGSWLANVDRVPNASEPV